MSKRNSILGKLYRSNKDINKNNFILYNELLSNFKI